jgi:hypothetical protein
VDQALILEWLNFERHVRKTFKLTPLTSLQNPPQSSIFIQSPRHPAINEAFFDAQQKHNYQQSPQPLQ